MNNIDSKTINFLRLPLAVGVVFIHLNINIKSSDINWSSFGGMDYYKLFAYVVTREFTNISVPLFFLISGFLFFYSKNKKASDTLPSSPRESEKSDYAPINKANWSKTIYFQKLERRIHTLLIPYIIFTIPTVIVLITSMSKGHPLVEGFLDWKWLHLFWNSHVTGSNTNILGITKPIAYPANVPLWFIRDLMVIVLMSPIVHYCIKKLSWLWLVIMGILSFTGIWIPLTGFSAFSMLYFSIGAWFSINNKSICETFKPLTRHIIIAAAVLLCVDLLADNTPYDKYVHPAFLLFGVIGTFSIGVKIVEANNPKIPKWAAPASFFIFATHAMPLIFTHKSSVEIAKKLICTNTDNPWLCSFQFVLAGFATAGVCLVFYLLLNHYFPNLCNLLTGRKTSNKPQ